MSQHRDDAVNLARTRRATKTEQYYLDLQTNERALLAASSRIYAAYVSRGEVRSDNIEEMIARSLHEAVRLAYTIERSVSEAEEDRS